MTNRKLVNNSAWVVCAILASDGSFVLVNGCELEAVKMIDINERAVGMTSAFEFITSEFHFLFVLIWRRQLPCDLQDGIRMNYRLQPNTL